MQYVSFRELQNIASLTLRRKLTSEGVLVVTENNKPFAALIGLNNENAQDILLLASRLHAQIAALSIRSQARKDGMDKTTLKDVNTVIKNTRAKQKRSK